MFSSLTKRNYVFGAVCFVFVALSTAAAGINDPDTLRPVSDLFGMVTTGSFPTPGKRTSNVTTLQQGNGVPVTVNSVSAGNTAISFGTSNAYVTFGDPAKLDLPAFTIETWFKRTGTGTSNTTGTGGITSLVPLVTHGAPEADLHTNVDANWILGINTTGNVIAADFEAASNSQNYPISGTTAITMNVWHHAAVTYDGTTWNLYLDGNLENTSSPGVAPRADSIQKVALGTMIESNGTTHGRFDGVIDEARVWNRALPASELLAGKDVELTSGTGLMARWGLNEGSGTVVGDSISPNPADGAITGTGYSWVPGFVPPAVSGSPNGPVLNAPANGISGVGASATLDVTVSDPDSDPLTVTYYGRPLAVGNFSQIAQNTGVGSASNTTTSWGSLLAGQTYEWYVTVSDGTNTVTGPTWTFHTTASTDPVFVGAGDIASCSVTEDTATGNILLGIDGTVFTTGDNVYTNGTAAEFATCYATTPWGDASVKSRTHPVPGNHDWGVGGPSTLSGYFGYYGASATDTGGNSYYSYDIAASNWHVVNLDSECELVSGGCSAGSAQDVWLKADLAANSTKNVIALWHKPRYSSGATKFTDIQPLWDDLYAAGVDIVLVGHDHVYERFAPMRSGVNLSDPPIADPTFGMTQFTVGTGGEGHHSFGTPLPTSVVRDGTSFGVLKLTLHATTYDWVFLPIAGSTFTDSGTGAVHGAPSAPNTAPVITEGASASATMSEDGSPTAFSLTLHATDANVGDTLTWSVSTAASHGTAAASGTGGSVSVSYTPTANYSGSDSFVVQVSDGNGGTDTITVNVTVDPVDDAPVITGQNSLTTSKNSPLTITLSNLTVTDIDNSYPTGFTLTAGDGTNYTHSGNTITPASNFVGTLTVPVTVNDGTAESNTFNLSINVTAGVIYYVDKTNASCSDTLNNGLTPAAPFCTITKGANVAVAGNTVRVLAGTYAETVNVPSSGAAGNPITFSAAPDVTVTGDGTASGNAFRMTSRSYIVIDGFTITDTVDYGIYASTSNHITISNNHVSSAGSPASGLTRMGIFFTNTDDSNITGNISEHNSQDGIRLTGGSSGNLVSNNISYGNAEEWQRNATGIQVTGVGSDLNLVIHNVTYGNEDSGLQFYAGAQSNLVIGNLTYGNGDHGIDCNDASGNSFTGNTVHGNVTAGINLEGAVGHGSGSAMLFNNLATDNGLRFQVGGGTASGQGTNIRVDAQSIVGTTMDYDLVYLSTGSGMIQWNGTTYASLAAFKTANPTQEVHGLQADPLFLSPVAIAQRPAGAPFNVAVNTGNYHLLSGSPAIDSANSDAPDEPGNDIEGTIRLDDPSTPNTGAGARTYDDRGCYEFQPLGTTAAPISIAGQVRTARGRGISNVIVTVWGSGLAQPVTARTTSFGYFRVEGLTAGGTYFVMVQSRRYAFSQPMRSVNGNDDVANFDFIAEEQ
jgi:parallel beta-helix repeat protein